MQPDTFMLGKNVAKANALVRGIWKDERSIDRALARANTAVTTNNQSAIDHANTALDRALRNLRRSGPYPDPMDLPEVGHLPDPFRFFNGGKVRSHADWNRRRTEIKALMQYYEFGTTPAPPALTATSVAHGASRDITIHMADGGRSASFTARLTLPTAEQAVASGKSAPFPVIVSLDYAVSNGNPNYLNAGYAVLSLPTAGVQSDNVAHTGAIFDLYPYDVAAGHDFGCLVGWAWGASRAIDALEFLVRNDPAYLLERDGARRPVIALDKLAVTGFSRWGKGALVAGMLDERFAVTHTGASGSGGAAPYRFMPFDHGHRAGAHLRDAHARLRRAPAVRPSPGDRRHRAARRPHRQHQ
jgi:endo-1,4-beta-xylanase